MITNARALVAGEDRFETSIDGKPWQQPVFSYPLKCLRWSREEFAAMSAQEQFSTRALLEDTGLLPMIDDDIGGGWRAQPGYAALMALGSLSAQTRS